MKLCFNFICLKKTNSNPPPSRALLLRFPSEAAASPRRIFQSFPSHRPPSGSRSTTSQHRCLPAEHVSRQTEPPCASLVGSRGRQQWEPPALPVLPMRQPLASQAAAPLSCGPRDPASELPAARICTLLAAMPSEIFLWSIYLPGILFCL